MPNFVRALTFRAALDQKLVTLTRAFGSSSEAARQCKVTLRCYNKWRTGERYPDNKLFSNIDDAYAMAVELLNNPELLKQRRTAAKKVKGLATKLRLSFNAVKQLQAEGLY